MIRQRAFSTCGLSTLCQPVVLLESREAAVMLALQYAEISPVTIVFLQAKHRERFFQLMEVFLSSNLVPASTVAAFAKRFARLSLTASPAGMCHLWPRVHGLCALHSVMACAGLHNTLRDLVHPHIRRSVLGLHCMAYVAVCACRCHDCNRFCAQPAAPASRLHRAAARTVLHSCSGTGSLCRCNRAQQCCQRSPRCACCTDV